jgi:hypothetical protein
MSIGPLNEIVISISNIIRKSEQGLILFPNNEIGEMRFSNWQKELLHTAELVHGHWNENNLIADHAVEMFENAFKIIIERN